jgi:predicted nucleic acid-binding protein
LRIFLDNSLLSDERLSGKPADEIVTTYASGNQFFVAAITHFQILWGYSRIAKPVHTYSEFLKAIRAEVLPLTKTDTELAASMKPSREDILDALIAASVKKYDGIIWTMDKKDFFKFLPKEKVHVLK